MTNDNRQIKDAFGDAFGLRTKDVSATGDGSVQRPMYLATNWPIDYGTGGVYSHCARIALTAGIAASSPIWSFMWTANNMLAVIRRLKLNVDVTGTAFAGAGTMHLDPYRATSFTTPDSGGTQVNLAAQSKLRSSMGASLAVIMYGSPLTPGTRTLDADPLDSIVLPVPSTPFAIIGSQVTIFDKHQGEHPLILAQNEGLVLRATPADATGTWHCNVTCEWDEVPLNII
jgi:hypothetical protein